MKTIVNVEAIKPVSTSLAKTHAKTLVESTLNAKHSIMVCIFVFNLVTFLCMFYDLCFG